MKGTGIVRRLDDLGRLVIPKEIRKQYRLKEGDSIAFYVDHDRIMIQKHDYMSAHIEDIIIMCETLHAMYQNTVFFIQDEVLKKQQLELQESFLEASHVHRMLVFEKKAIFKDKEETYDGIIYPITSFGDWYGAFVMLYDQKRLEKDQWYALEAFAQLLSRQQIQ